MGRVTPAIAAIACRTERCRSLVDRTALLMRGPRKVDRGFKSHPLRHGQSGPLGFGLFPFSALVRGFRPCQQGGNPRMTRKREQTLGHGRHIVAFSLQMGQTATELLGR